MIATDFYSDRTRLASSMFARWCQENFFKYMREHFNLDRLVEYGTESVPATTRLVNPAWRQLDGQVRTRNGKLQRQMALFGELSLETLEKSEGYFSRSPLIFDYKSIAEFKMKNNLT